ncbi:SGNH/GDSL hydrolase family protein [Kribbella sp. CA-293567]|uniref:SGNH/GDSL hydrolase family protein n=1 Tax=Kribbella sp. CA-293567 TaxID=3002436 RepID=UPI0022DE1F97|nr:SGNH/GDSL hydrolase family protein [Kribbella sp. CA-293567]WBQ07508.1 SGNH/GDSL hydrolase family protein [Kribbella sp. CA-293567]
MALLGTAERHYERSAHDHTTPIGVLHQLVVRWGDAERTTSRRAFRRWCDGVAVVDVQARTFAEYWDRQNETALIGDGPLWVVLGDSTAQGLGATSPLHGYVGQVADALNHRSDRPWRILNLSRAGAQAAHVLHDQLSRLDALGVEPDLVTCGIGSNDILGTAPKKVHGNLRALIQRLPSSSVVMDLLLPDRFWAIGGLCTPYVAGINRTIHRAAAERGLPVAELSRHVRPPWRGKLAPDLFHPNDRGYQPLANALLAALPATLARSTQASGLRGPSASSR